MNQFRKHITIDIPYFTFAAEHLQTRNKLSENISTNYVKVIISFIPLATAKQIHHSLLFKFTGIDWRVSFNGHIYGVTINNIIKSLHGFFYIWYQTLRCCFNSNKKSLELISCTKQLTLFQLQNLDPKAKIKILWPENLHAGLMLQM